MEYEYNEPVRKGHGGLALVFGILSIVITIAAGFLFGMFGLVPAFILAVRGSGLGISSIRATHRSGKGGVITGIIGILLAAMTSGLVLSIGSFLKTEEIREKVPLLADYADESWRGTIGILLKMNADHVDFDEVTKQLNDYTNGAAGQDVVSTEAAN